MIERLRLHRWRAFDDVDLALDAGTTFIVAPNGVGKTSLLLGMAWAVFGEGAVVDPRANIRLGSDDAEAEVTLRIGENQLIIRRSIGAKGRSSAKYILDGETIASKVAITLLEGAFGVELPVAGRLSVMVGGGLEESNRPLDLESHLYRAFGVTALREAAEQSAATARAAAKTRQIQRSATSKRLDDRRSLEQDRTTLEARLKELHAERSTLTKNLDQASASRHVAELWRQYEAALGSRAEILQEVETQAQVLNLQTGDHLQAEVESAVTSVRQRLVDLAERVAHARSRILAAEAALELLEADEPTCPTCLRAFHGDELGQAVLSHQAAIGVAEAELAELKVEDDSSRRLLNEAEAFHRLLLRVPPEPSVPPPIVVEDSEIATAEALNSLQTHDEGAGRVEHQLETVTQALRDDDAILELEAAQLRAYRREAATRAVSLALTDATERVIRDHLEPLSQEIRWRWKLLFGEDGLRLRPDGSIVRAVGDRELDWNSLSGGERIWARLVTHLLVLGSSTAIPFAWFDEPLEHLDPRSRRAVASALATATRGDSPKQLIVTTYEHAIARQLASDVPEAAITYVRRSLG